jgi:UTP--glucose-1-phosphate uridylyltransferase
MQRENARDLLLIPASPSIARSHAMSRPFRKIRKAVFPVAGLGTRFLPATKAMPKEMLTVVDRPVIQHVVDEARAAGIEHFIFVTGRNKGMIEDHFDIQFELERTLAERGKKAELEALTRDLPAAGQASFTRQQAPLGLGHAVWCAREIVGDEPFALLLPDMLHHGSRPCLADMIDAYDRRGGNHIAVSPVPEDQTHQYGIVGVADSSAPVSPISTMVEKPPRGTAPSNLHITGRYILQPEIFELLSMQERGAGGEIQLTDSMIRLQKEQDFFAVRFDGAIYDCGSKIGFLMANVAYALAREDLGPALKAELRRLL